MYSALAQKEFFQASSFEQWTWKSYSFAVSNVHGKCVTGLLVITFSYQPVVRMARGSVLFTLFSHIALQWMCYCSITIMSGFAEMPGLITKELTLTSV
jgi:hypothetical protein